MRTPRCQSAGYTLMELIAVIMVIAAVASIALPEVGNFNAGLQLLAQASILTSDLRLARSWAISEQVYTRVVFNADLSSWVVQEHVSGGVPVIGEPSPALTVGQATDFLDVAAKWSNIDGDSREPDAMFQVEAIPAGAPAIFFRHDGMLVSHPSATGAPIGVKTVRFKTENGANMDVEITPNGALESTEFYSSD